MQTLEESIKAGDVAEVRRLLEQNPETLNAAMGGAPSPLLLAVYHGQTAVADVIRQYRPKLDAFEAAATGDRHQLSANLALNPGLHREVSADGFTPLGYAAYFGHRELVDDLLAAGADPNVPSQNPMGVTPLHSALAGGHKEMARAMIERGGDVNVASAGGWTPLHYAADSGDVETARYLLDRGARPAANADGKTPTDLALAKGHTGLAALLDS